MIAIVRLRSFLCACAVAVLTMALPALADEAPQHCHGTDMLAEMQSTSPVSYQAVMDESRQTSNTEAMLWKIEKPGIAPSYLMGTMHLTDPRIAKLPDKAKEAIAHAKSVALEVADLSDKAVAAAMAKAQGLLVYADGKTLQAQLSDDEFKKVRQVVTKAGMPENSAVVLKPWLISMLLATSDCERQQVASGAKVLDLEVAAEAQKDGLTVTGLETIEKQLSALASISNDQQIAMLKVGLKYADRSNDLMETLVQMYLKRQIGAAMPFQLALAAEAGVPASAFDGFKKILLIDRNAGMRDAALPLLDNGNAFIAVGALHLVGPDGLVALLRKSGYTVTAVE